MHQRISKKITIYLFIFFTLGTITNTKLNKNFFKINDFKVVGLNEKDTKKIYKNLQILKNQNIFLLNKKNLSNKIYSNKIVEELKIFKNYPSSLTIEIKKTKFLAITKKNNINYLIGANGNLIKIDYIPLKIPFIYGNVNIKNFLHFKNLIDRSKFEFNNIKDLYYFKSNRWNIVTKGGVTLQMPSNLTVEYLNIIFIITKSNDFKDKKIIDFRQNNMVFVDG